jgi:outer membrane protein assembly factor BamB
LLRRLRLDRVKAMKTMNCECVEEQLDRLVLGDLTGGEEALLRGHLDACLACREAADRHRKLTGDLRDYAGERHLHSPHFAALSNALAHEVRHERRAQERRYPILLKIAAGLVMAVGVGVMAASFLKDRPGRADFRVVWQQEGVAVLAGAVNPYPLVQGNMLLTLERTGGVLHLAALDRETGARAWATPFAVLEVFAADASTIYVWTPAMGGLELVALDKAAGRERWRRLRPMSRGMAATPALSLAAPGVCWAEGGTVFMADGETGAVRWSRTLARRGGVSLASPDGVRIYAATADEALALDASDGRTIWQRLHERPDGMPATGALVACNGGREVCIALRYASVRGRLVCLDSGSGADRWHREIGLPLSLQVTPGHVVVRGAALEVFDDRTGNRLWAASLPGCAPVTWVAGRLYVLGGKARPAVFLLDGHTGRHLGTQPLASSCTGLVIDGHRSYLSGSDGVLYALKVGG